MTILREVTNEKHRDVENTPLIQAMFRSEITREEYVHYLNELLYIYSNLERLAKEVGVLDDLQGIERTQALKDDLEELAPGHSSDVCESTKEYVRHIEKLVSDESTKHLILAHVYVRHMGDLYGGKVLSRFVPGSGNAYKFEDRPNLIKKLSDKLTHDLDQEALKAFDYFIKIFNELWLKIHK